MKQTRDQSKKNQRSSLSWLLLLSLITIAAMIGLSGFINKSIEALANNEIVLSHNLPKASDSNPPPFVF